MHAFILASTLKNYESHPQCICVVNDQKKLGYAVAQLVEATSWKVAGSIPQGVIGILHWLKLPAALWPWGRLIL